MRICRVFFSAVFLFVSIFVFSLKADEKKTDLPVLKRSVLFNTPEADQIMSKIQIFPPDNPWNQDISDRPVHPNSDKMISTYGSNQSLLYNLDMGFTIVPPDQPKVNVKLVDYPQESDPGPYPVPDNAHVEGYPIGTPGGSLDGYQRMGKDYNGPGGGDRHSLILDPYHNKIYEFYRMIKTNSGWQASNEATFDLTTNVLRPAGWTSSDAAGLPVLPASVRFDEVERGIVAHAMRITFVKTRKDIVPPATHYASSTTDNRYAAMGDRLRLKKDFDVSRFSPHPKAILLGMKKYGIFVADNGGNWRISIAPDSRIKNLKELEQVKASDFEFVKPEENLLKLNTDSQKKIKGTAVFGKVLSKTAADTQTVVTIQLESGKTKDVTFGKGNFIKNGSEVTDPSRIPKGIEAAIVTEEGTDKVYLGIDAATIYKERQGK